MVNLSHMSNGITSSVNSSLRDLSVAFGDLNPNPPLLAIPDPDMAESEPILSKVSVDPTDSDLVTLDSLISSDVAAAENSGVDFNCPLSSQDTQDIFKAAHFFSSSDRQDLVSERKKNLDLSSFIKAKGFSMQEVNDFLSAGQASRIVNEHDMIVKAPVLEDCSGSTKLHPTVSVDERPGMPESSKCVVVNASNPSTDKPTPVEDQMPEVKKSWSKIVSQGQDRGPDKPMVNLEYFPPPPETVDGPIIVQPPVEVLKEGNSLWNSCLVGRFINSRLPFKLVDDSAHKMWDKFGLLKVFLQDRGFFVFKFSCPADRDNVLALGPWYISNKLLVIKHWKEGVDFITESCAQVPVWVKFHHVPLSYWTPKGLSFLASSIGKPLFLDKVTELMEPLNFARICIEVSAASTFPEKVDVIVLDEDSNEMLSLEVKVEYQNKPQLCPHCKSFGHSKLRCPRASYIWVPKSNVASSSAPHTGLKCGGPSSHCFPAQTDCLDLETSPKASSDDWTVVAKGPKTLPCTAFFPNSEDTCNAFTPIAPSESLADLDCSPPSHNPLVDKLKIIDEIEGRQQKKKAGGPVGGPGGPADHNKKSKKKTKAGGGSPSPFT